MTGPQGSIHPATGSHGRRAILVALLASSLVHLIAVAGIYHFKSSLVSGSPGQSAIRVSLAKNDTTLTAATAGSPQKQQPPASGEQPARQPPPITNQQGISPQRPLADAATQTRPIDTNAGVSHEVPSATTESEAAQVQTVESASAKDPAEPDPGNQQIQVITTRGLASEAISAIPRPDTGPLKSERTDKREPTVSAPPTVDEPTVTARQSATARTASQGVRAMQALPDARFPNLPPAYPRIARLKGWEGVTAIKVTVLPNHDIGNVEVIESSGYRILDKAAVRAIRKWRFIGPANGDQPGYYEHRFRFRLD